MQGTDALCLSRFRATADFIAAYGDDVITVSGNVASARALNEIVSLPLKSVIWTSVLL